MTAEAGTDNSTAHFTALCDTSKPLPAFIEGWALNSFMGVNVSGTPSGTGLPTDSESQHLLEYNISGVAGDSTVTINSGDLAKFASIGMVVQHDDGTYGTYSISNLSGSVCTVFPNVRSTITSKVMGNFGADAVGQHLSEKGYKALSRQIYATDRKSAYRMRYAARWKARTGLASDWTAVGGIGGQFLMTTGNPFLSDTTNRSFGSWISRGRTYLSVAPSVSPSGKGVTKTFSLGGNSGFLEAFASCGRSAGNGNPQYFWPFRCVVVVDGVTLLDQTFTENDGLQRIIVPYTNGTTGSITFTLTSATVIYSGGINIGDVTWWAYDRTPSGYAWTDSVIDKNAKTVVIGDSWTTRYSAVLGTELQAAMTAAGGSGTVVSVGIGGTTAQNHGLTDFDLQVVPEAPAQVVILFFTNDHNSYGDTGYERWLKYMYQIGRRCQAIGARPIFVMPLPTQSFSQAVGHGIWAEELGAGLAI